VAVTNGPKWKKTRQMAGIDKTYAVSAQGHHLQADGQICGRGVSGDRLVRNEQLNITSDDKQSF